MSVPSQRLPLGQWSTNTNKSLIALSDKESERLVEQTAGTAARKHAPTSVHSNPSESSFDDDLALLMTQKLTLDPQEMMDDVDEVTGEVTTIDWKKENQQMDKMFESQSAQQLQGLPPFQRPRGIKDSVVFMEHQEQGITWLLQQELNAPPNPFVRGKTLKDGTAAFYDKLTRHRIRLPHAPVKGSILADDMGLGKTLQTLALILSNPPKNYMYGSSGIRMMLSDTPICTLIVCPKTVISNWISQTQDFVEPNFLKTVVYQGTPVQRSGIIQKVKGNKVDVLLATYETIASEHDKDRVDKYGKKLRGVHDLNFHRTVLDEAQQIRNNKSKTYKAIEAVAQQSEYRLALSGTPFVNKPEDVMSLLSYIGLQPLADPAIFKEFISDPIKERRRAGLTRLRVACSYVALRRTKNIVPNIGIADKTIHIHAVDFPKDSIHKNIYESLYLACRVAMRASLKGVGRMYTEDGEEKKVSITTHRAMFAMLMRVRQSCASGALVSAAHYKVASELMQNLRDENGNIKELTADDGERMLHLLQNAKGADDSRVEVKENSPKINFLLNAIGQMQPDEKGVIFSQWTSMLDLVQKALEAAGHRFTRIDGSMSTDERTQALHNLSRSENCRFILCSLKAAGVGINLTRANVCFMMDPWWNDAIESQAIDRVHRVGQKRSVRVYRLVMKDSIEERLLNVQKAKSTLGKGTMTKLTKAEEKIAKLTGLKDLFEIDDVMQSGGDGKMGSDDWLDH